MINLQQNIQRMEKKKICVTDNLIFLACIRIDEIRGHYRSDCVKFEWWLVPGSRVALHRTLRNMQYLIYVI